MSRTWPPSLAPVLASVLASVLGLACAGGPAPSGSAAPAAERRSFSFFAEAPRDVWSDKIDDWQARQRRDGPALSEPPDDRYLRPPTFALLLEKSDSFRRRERRALAGRIAAFSQEEARRHFLWDPETGIRDDPWPTSVELYAKNGDDCDGLDLIAYDLLRAFGFPERDLYRVVVRRDSDGANHMATLWFEDRDDPWVVDATGAITRRMRRFSELVGWTPLRLFDEDEQWGIAASAAPIP